MSAFVVSHTHINALVKFACLHNLAFYDGARLRHTSGNEQAAAQMLLDENVRSVNYRYKENAETDRIIYDIFAPKLNPVQAIKAAQCFEYQSCETADWEQSTAKNFIDAIISRAITNLHGYKEANWEISNPAMAAA